MSRLLEDPGRLFAVADATRDAQVLMAVRGLGIEARCLYRGDEAIRLATYAPYLLSFGATLHPLARYLDLGWSPWIRNALGTSSPEPAARGNWLLAASRRYLRQVIGLIGTGV